MKQGQHKHYLTIASLLALPILVPLLLFINLPKNAATGKCERIKVINTTSSAEFSLAGLASRGGRPIYTGESFAHIEGGSFCAEKDFPLSARGRTTLPDTARVWSVLEVAQGELRVQAKPVQISTGEWIAADLRPETGTRRILLVSTDTDGDVTFKSSITNGRNAVIQKLPAGTQELAVLNLE